MEIELPDGTVLEAPDGSDVRQVVRGYNIAKLKRANPAEYDSNSKEFQAKYGPLARGTTKVPIRGLGMVEVPEDDKFTEGIGSGLTRFTRGVGNLETKALNAHPLIKALGGVKLPHGEEYTDEALKTQDELDKPLLSTGKGIAGNIVGSAAPAYLTTMGTGALSSLKGAPSVLARTLGHPTVRAALEGAGTAAAMAPAGEQGKGAAAGAVVGAGLERAFAGIGRGVRGLVQKSEPAQDLEQLAGQHGMDIHIPLAQAAGEQDWITRLLKAGYQEALPLIPGTTGRLKKQSADAVAQVRELALREAAPNGTVLPANPGKNAGESVHAIDAAIRREYEETVGKTTYRLSSTLPSQLEQRIRQANPTVDDQTVTNTLRNVVGLMRRFSNGTSRIHGNNLVQVRDELERLAGRSRGNEQSALQAAQQGVEDMIHAGLPKEAADRFANLAEPERHFEGILGATDAAAGRGGNFTMDQLASHATDPTQKYLASTAGEVFREPVTKSSLPGRIIAGLGLGGYGAFIDFPTAAGTFIVGNIAATKTAQKALMGDTDAQRAIASYIINHPHEAASVEQVMRSVGTTQAGRDE